MCLCNQCYVNSSVTQQYFKFVFTVDQPIRVPEKDFYGVLSDRIHSGTRSGIPSSEGLSVELRCLRKVERTYFMPGMEVE